MDEELRKKIEAVLFSLGKIQFFLNPEKFA
jgi:hypothetical protein